MTPRPLREDLAWIAGIIAASASLAYLLVTAYVALAVGVSRGQLAEAAWVAVLPR